VCYKLILECTCTWLILLYKARFKCYSYYSSKIVCACLFLSNSLSLFESISVCSSEGINWQFFGFVMMEYLIERFLDIEIKFLEWSINRFGLFQYNRRYLLLSAFQSAELSVLFNTKQAQSKHIPTLIKNSL